MWTKPARAGQGLREPRVTKAIRANQAPKESKDLPGRPAPPALRVRKVKAQQHSILPRQSAYTL